MKLFQIEEPEGGPADPDAPGAAIAVDLSGAVAIVAFAVGGNAVVLDDRAGFELMLSVPSPAADQTAWQELFEGARLRAERALLRPVSHAVVILATAPDADFARHLTEAAAAAGVALLQLAAAADLAGTGVPALAAAIRAEELAPRPESLALR